jgi:hypothetical protein
MIVLHIDKQMFDRAISPFPCELSIVRQRFVILEPRHIACLPVARHHHRKIGAMLVVKESASLEEEQQKALRETDS